MGSPFSAILEKAAQETAEESSARLNKRLDAVLKKMQPEIQGKLQSVIEHDMYDYYYGGYSPHRYMRTGILRNTLVSPVVRTYDGGGIKGFVFGVNYTPENMHHIATQSYNKSDRSVDENMVAQNFSEGVHPIPWFSDLPRVDQGTIWAMGEPSGHASDIMWAWAQEHLPKMFMEAVSSVLK